MTAMDPMPQTACCGCGSAVFYARAQVVGERGHFHCRWCGRRYRSSEEGWTPGAKVCTCCEREVDELVTAPRKDGSPQPVCRECRDIILGTAKWDVLYASTRRPADKKDSN
jgi:hypothetical protein